VRSDLLDRDRRRRNRRRAIGAAGGIAVLAVSAAIGPRMLELAAPRIDTRNTHGTGCTLSAALAALLPQSADVPAAARRAKAYLGAAIAAADALAIGHGHGPVHHFHALWPVPMPAA